MEGWGSFARVRTQGFMFLLWVCEVRPAINQNGNPLWEPKIGCEWTAMNTSELTPIRSLRISPDVCEGLSLY